MGAIGGLCWTTKGRQVENYIPPSALEAHYDAKPERAIDKYEAFDDYLEEVFGAEDDMRRLFVRQIRARNEPLPRKLAVAIGRTYYRIDLLWLSILYFSKWKGGTRW